VLPTPSLPPLISTPPPPPPPPSFNTPSSKKMPSHLQACSQRTTTIPRPPSAASTQQDNKMPTKQRTPPTEKTDIEQGLTAIHSSRHDTSGSSPASFSLSGIFTPRALRAASILGLTSCFALGMVCFVTVLWRVGSVSSLRKAGLLVCAGVVVCVVGLLRPGRVLHDRLCREVLRELEGYQFGMWMVC
jgi:hypothetical protein